MFLSNYLDEKNDRLLDCTAINNIRIKKFEFKSKCTKTQLTIFLRETKNGFYFTKKKNLEFEQTIPKVTQTTII
jgi:hypothetical protein